MEFGSDSPSADFMKTFNTTVCGLNIRSQNKTLGSWISLTHPYKLLLVSPDVNIYNRKLLQSLFLQSQVVNKDVLQSATDEGTWSAAAGWVHFKYTSGTQERVHNKLYSLPDYNRLQLGTAKTQQPKVRLTLTCGGHFVQRRRRWVGLTHHWNAHWLTANHTTRVEDHVQRTKENQLMTT